MLGSPLRGYRTADEYGTFLDRVLRDTRGLDPMARVVR
jgi:hypothetical protein